MHRDWVKGGGVSKRETLVLAHVSSPFGRGWVRVRKLESRNRRPDPGFGFFFDLDPTSGFFFDLDPTRTTMLSTLVPRLNVHHKQLFFSDNPIFVEGILDAQ